MPLSNSPSAFSIALVLLLPLLWRFVPGRAREPGDWQWRADGPLLLLAAGLGGALQNLWLVQFTLAQGSVASSDFGDWCAAVSSMAHGRPEIFPGHRPMLPARFLAPLAQWVGTADSLLLSAQLCAHLICGALYVWGRALHGRLAGLSAALLAGTVGPLVSLSHTLSFYPHATAAFAWGAALAAWAARSGRAGAMVMAGLGVGACLLVELRGLIWALPLLGVAALGLLRRPWGLNTALRTLALGAPLVGAWFAAPLAWHPDTGSLEEQADVRARFWEMGIHEAQYAPPYSHSTRYVWGVTPITDIPATLLHFREQRALFPPEAVMERYAGAARRKQVQPWMPLMKVCAALSVLALLRRPVLLLALIGTVIPFGVAMQGAVTMQMGALRFLGQAAPFVPLILGIGVAALAQGGPSSEPSPWDLKARAWFVGAVGLVLALTLGLIPSMLSPAAPWRPRPDPLPDGFRAVRCYVGTAAGHTEACLGGEQARDPRCTLALSAELKEGKNLRSLAIPPEASP